MFFVWGYRKNVHPINFCNGKNIPQYKDIFTNKENFITQKYSYIVGEF